MAKTILEHYPVATANAAGATTAIVFVVCRLAFALAPDFTMQIARSWFHGIDITLIAAQAVGWDSFILGLATATAGAWLAGYLFAALYNTFAK